MIKSVHTVLTSIALSISIVILMVAPHIHAAEAGEACTLAPATGISFLKLPTWYQYLPGQLDPAGKCIPQISGCKADSAGNKNTCLVTTHSDGSGIDAAGLWLIALAILQLLLRLGGFAAFAMVIFGGFKYITSQGNSDATKAARQTIINAFIGIVISIIAAASVSFGVGLLQR